MSTLSRAVGRVALGALLLLGARDGAAQVSVTTPLLEGLGTHVCRAANPATPVMNLAVTLNLRGGGGQILATSGLIPLAPGQSAETTFDSTGSDGTLYCEAVANTNTEADHLRVDDIFRDSNGNALAAVRGSRTGSGSIPLASPGLSADTNSRLTCAAVAGSVCTSGARKKTLMSTPRATASVCSDVSEIDERPRSTSDRKLIEKPVTRPTSRSERSRSRRRRRMVVPTSASRPPASWRRGTAARVMLASRVGVMRRSIKLNAVSATTHAEREKHG